MADDVDLVEAVAAAAYTNWTGEEWPVADDGAYLRAVRAKWRAHARAVLAAVGERLVPAGGELRTEWGIQDKTGKVYPCADQADAGVCASHNPLTWVASRRCYDGRWTKQDEPAEEPTCPT